MLTDAFGQAPQEDCVSFCPFVFCPLFLFCPILSSIFLYFFSRYFSSLHSMLHLKQSYSPRFPSMIYNAEWLDTISKRAFSNHSWVYACMNVCSSDRRWIIFLPVFGIALLIEAICRWLGKPPSILLNTISSLVVQCFVRASFGVWGQLLQE